ncbi:MAG: hypothetical protein WCE83_14730, partial [Candidatus Baltobacteraceae bacterium]
IEVETALQQRERLEANAGGSPRQAGELERHHQPHDGARQRRADSGSMGEHDIDLELAQVGRGDRDAGELAEAGVDAVDRVALGDDRLDRPGPGVDLRAARFVEPAAGAEVDLPPGRQRNRPGFQDERVRARPERRQTFARVIAPSEAELTSATYLANTPLV